MKKSVIKDIEDFKKLVESCFLDKYEYFSMGDKKFYQHIVQKSLISKLESFDWKGLFQEDVARFLGDITEVLGVPFCPEKQKADVETLIKLFLQILRYFLIRQPRKLKSSFWDKSMEVKAIAAAIRKAKKKRNLLEQKLFLENFFKKLEFSNPAELAAEAFRCSGSGGEFPRDRAIRIVAKERFGRTGVRLSEEAMKKLIKHEMKHQKECRRIRELHSKLRKGKTT